jgi:hypothetical protein
MPAKYWIKLWVELLDDPKMGSLPHWLWRRFIEFCLVAGEVGRDGLLQPVPQLAWRLRMSEQECEEALRALSAIGVVAKEPDGWIVVNYAKRQSPVSSTERVQEHRKYAAKPPRDDEHRVKGVYAIFCDPAKKVYIGGSIDIEKRIRTHFSEMKSPGSRMSEDYQKYGQKAMRAEILEVIEVGPIDNAERKWITRYRGEGWALYNAEEGKRNRYWKGDGTKRSIEAETETEQNRREVEEEGFSPEHIVENSPPPMPPPSPASSSPPVSPLPARISPAVTASLVSEWNNGDRARAAERIYREITGQVCIPPDNQAQALDTLGSILDYYRGDIEQAITAGRPVFAVWCNTRGKSGRTYSPTNTAWLTKWLERLAPHPLPDRVDTVALRVKHDIERLTGRR